MQAERAKSTLRKLAIGGVIAAVVGGAGCAIGYLGDSQNFLRAYLPPLVYFCGLSLGSLAIVMIHHLVGGRWGDVSRRSLEAGALPLVAMILLASPIIFGAAHLYPWAADSGAHDEHADAAGSHPAKMRPASANDNHSGDEEFFAKSVERMDLKRAYLDLSWFRTRSAVYLGIWAVLVVLLIRWSLRGDERSRAQALQERLTSLSGPGLVVFFVTVTFASIDWMMSLDPHWFSAVYGILIIGGQGVTGFALAIVATAWLKHRCDAEAIDAEALHDLGKLLLAAVSFWMYISFCQYLIAWSGNLPEEIVWYVRRSTTVWTFVAYALVVGHFVIPFALLLSRGLKRRPVPLAAVAGWLLLIHVLDVYWLILPEYPAGARGLSWVDPAAWLAVGGVWLAVFAWWFAAHPLIPASALAPAGAEREGGEREKERPHG